MNKKLFSSKIARWAYWCGYFDMHNSKGFYRIHPVIGKVMRMVDSVRTRWSKTHRNNMYKFLTEIHKPKENIF